ncbi:tyrosine--tRNA ligase [Candidatus Gracilibacteria bacterium CG2_30_37_12]|nr:MAG: tyrosine--tRNA ligase [Candidatus Gracilibacteria bacterium CG2_30_37_12]
MPQKKDILIQNLLTKGVSRIIDREHLEEQLRSDKKLRIKFGIDPTGTVVHIGHAVPILKLRAFQELGHQIVLIIGDSTAQVGDTSDKDAERPMLKREETRKNAENYLAQFGKILDLSKLEVHYNSEWMDTTNFNTVGELAKNFSVAEMLDRDNFSKRFKAGIRISLQEFLYPIMQGWDNVQVKADVEVGGNDQYFNLLAGRPLQEVYGQSKQAIMTFNLIEGTDGRKMSKTYKNFIGLSDAPNDMFVKIMEIKDELILLYFIHCTTLLLSEIEPYKARLLSDENPKYIKMDLASIIVSLYHGEEAAIAGKVYFEKVLTDGIVPSEEEIEKAYLDTKEIDLGNLLKEIKLCATTGDVKNALSGGSIRVNNEVVSDSKMMISLSSEKGILIQMGKKKFRNVFLK